MDAKLPVYRFLTLTFGKGLHKFQPQTLVRETLPSIHKYMKAIALSYTLSVELTEAGVVHYHIVMSVKDFIKYKIFNNYWTRHYGFIKSIAPSTLEKAIDYTEKEQNETLKLLFGLNYPVINEGNIGEVVAMIKAPLEKESKTILDYFQK